MSKIRGAIKRIDVPPKSGSRAETSAFFGDDAVIGKIFGEALDDAALGTLVRLGNQIGFTFVSDAGRPLEFFAENFAGFESDFRGSIEIIFRHVGGALRTQSCPWPRERHFHFTIRATRTAANARICRLDERRWIAARMRAMRANLTALWLRMLALLTFPLVLGAADESKLWLVLTRGIESNLRAVSADLNHPSDTKVAPELVIWAAGSNGVVLRSPDEGKTWKRLHVEGGEKLDFRSRFVSPPENAVDVMVRFASVQDTVAGAK